MNEIIQMWIRALRSAYDTFEMKWLGMKLVVSEVSGCKYKSDKIEYSKFEIEPTKNKNKIQSCHFVKSVQVRSFFWPVFSRIRTEYGEILRIYPYSVRMRENTDHKKLRIWTLFRQCASSEDLKFCSDVKCKVVGFVKNCFSIFRHLRERANLSYSTHLDFVSMYNT